MLPSKKEFLDNYHPFKKGTFLKKMRIRNPLTSKLLKATNIEGSASSTSPGGTQLDEDVVQNKHNDRGNPPGST
jgi:hypothetical protein